MVGTEKGEAARPRDEGVEDTGAVGEVCCAAVVVSHGPISFQACVQKIIYLSAIRTVLEGVA